MRLFFLTNHFLDGHGGGGFATLAYANAFSEVYDECMLMYPDRGKPINESVKSTYQLIGVKNKRTSFRKLTDVYVGRTHWFHDVAYKQIAEYKPDLVVFDNSRCSLDLIEKIKKLRIKVVTIHHNFESEYFKGTPPSLLWRLPFMHYLKRSEREALLNSDINFALTNQDAASLKQYYAKDTDVTIVTTGCFEFCAHETDQLHVKTDTIKFVITGSLSAKQTEVSLIPFIKDFYPKLVALYPDVELLVAGKDPSPSLQTLLAQFPLITLIANPDNIQEVINQATVYICPVSVGGGLKLRIMDGLKAGLPVLTHSVSARGYDAFIDDGLMYAYDDLDSFVTGINTLMSKLKQDMLPNQFIKNKYDKHFSYVSGIERVKQALMSLD